MVYETPWSDRDLARPALTPRNIRNYFRKVARAGPNDCWLWTGAISGDGRPAFSADGVMRAASHVALILDGSPRRKPPHHHALHGDCSNPLCLNPRHLRWGTNDENVRDKERLGRAPRQNPRANAKLTPDDVRMVRASPMSGKALARQLGVTPGAISLIRTGRNWSSVT